MMQPASPRKPDMTRRTDQWTCGLFDTGQTGGADLGFVSPAMETCQTPDLLTEIDVSDIFGSIKEPDLIGLDNMGPFGLDIGNDGDFLEDFTDLSSYLLGESDEANLVALETTESTSSLAPMVSGSEGGSTLKRTAEEAFECSALLPPNPDHNDYACKAKMARTSCGKAMPSNSVDSTTGKPLTNKYRERRQKNNIASKRSRETRKHKFVVKEQQAIDLELANAQLKVQAVELEKLTTLMKNTLVKRLAGK